MSDSKCPKKDEAKNETGHRQPEALGHAEMLVKEMEEINSWARLVYQLYFAWFGLQFTVNGAAIAWLFTASVTPWFSRLVFMVFAGWNLMGTIGSVGVYKGLLQRDRRIREVIYTINELHGTDTDARFYPQSPMVRSSMRNLFGFCIVSMVFSLSFWIVMLVANR